MPARVVRDHVFEFEGAKYSFAPLATIDKHLETSQIEVHVSFDAARFGVSIEGHARWCGRAEEFRRSIAPSRTFGAARELEYLRKNGLAAHVPAGSIVALDVDDPVYKPRDPGEPVRHKLLDLIGDLAPIGAPLFGVLHAYKPSHRATRTIVDSAIDLGVMVFS